MKNLNNFQKLKNLFWDYDMKSVRKNLFSPFVIARVLEMGNPEHFKILHSIVGDDEIVKFLRIKGNKLLSKRSLNFWKIYYEKKTEKRT